MNEANRNTRTLIVSFLIAIAVLVPLRFVEIGEMGVGSSETQVLGETISDRPGCVQKADIDLAWGQLKLEIETNQVDQEQAKELVANLVTAQKNICK